MKILSVKDIAKILTVKAIVKITAQYIVHYTIYSVQYTVYSAVHSILCAMYSILEVAKLPRKEVKLLAGGG